MPDRWLKVPDERIGLLFVFRVFDRVVLRARAQYVGPGRRRQLRSQSLAAPVCERAAGMTRRAATATAPPMIVDSRVQAWARLQLAEIAPRPLVDVAARLRDAGRRARGDAGAAPPIRTRNRAAPLDAPPDAARLDATLAWLSRTGSRPRRLGRSGLPRPTARDRRSAAGALLPRPARASRGTGVRDRGQSQCNAPRMRGRRSVRRRTLRGRLRHRQRTRPRRRCGSALRWTPWRRQQHRGDRHRSRSRLSGPQSRTRARSRGARTRPLRVRHRHATAEAELSAPQSPRERPRPRRARGRGHAFVRIAHYGATRRRAGTRSLRAAGIDPLAVFERRAPAHSRRREARRDGAGHPRRARRSWRPRRRSLSPARVQSPTPSSRTVMRALGHDPADVETLAASTRLSIAALVAALTALELDGRVASLPGGIWQRVG